MSVLLEIFHALQACGAMLAGLFSAMAIYNLQQWEPQTQTAAKYSNMAAQQLQKTRTTQASGAIAVSRTSSLQLTAGFLTAFTVAVVSNLIGLLRDLRFVRQDWHTFRPEWHQCRRTFPDPSVHLKLLVGKSESSTCEALQ
jgi:hypothetical protein